MENRDIIAIGASAGGVEAIAFLARNLPRQFPASILVTIHLSSNHHSVLDEVLSNVGPMPAVFAKDGASLRKGTITLAPVDRHLLVEADRIVLGRGVRENNARPAIDSMLRSVAVCCGPRVIGVVLTGTLNDGASGLWAIEQCGGVTVVQDPNDAAFPEMPTNALNRVQPDHVIPLAEMPKLLSGLTHQPAGPTVQIPECIAFEVEIAKGAQSTVEDMERLGRHSVLACPDCHGVMWEIDEGELRRYRCHVGHSYTAELLSIALDENLRGALGSALRALEERRALARRLERQARERGSNRKSRLHGRNGPQNLSAN